MKKLSLFVVVCAFAAVACGCASSTAVRTRDADLVAKYQQTLEQSKACETDADCVAVSKGCCLCDGQEAVNKKFQNKLDACGVGPCTLQMCYTDIDVACVNHVCTGTLKPMSSYIPQ